MPEFWRFYDADATGEAAERAHSLDTQFIAPNAAIYRAAGFGRYRGPIDDTRLAAWLEAFDPLASAARRVSQMLPDAWREHDLRFTASFPAYRPGAPAYLLVSLFDFNVHGESWRGRPCLFAGVDGIVKLGGETPDLAVLLDHEDFHIYHAQANPGLWPPKGAPPLWIALWREGLATYVSARLNPKASPADVLMSEDLAALGPEALPPLAAQALAALETTDAGQDQRFLQLGYKGDTPARSGYLLGLRLAERAGRSLSLDQLARLPAAKVHGFMRKELSQIAHG